jgi:nucleoid-associated protein YgaU
MFGQTIEHPFVTVNFTTGPTAHITASWKENPMSTTIDPLLFSPQVPRTSSGRVHTISPKARPSERTFRRRRRVLGVAVVFMAATAVIASGAVASDPSQENVSVPRTVIAQQGDTLWDIARTIVPKGSIGDLVTDMVRLNGSHIEPGQVVRIP